MNRPGFSGNSSMHGNEEVDVCLGLLCRAVVSPGCWI